MTFSAKGLNSLCSECCHLVHVEKVGTLRRAKQPSCEYTSCEPHNPHESPPHILTHIHTPNTPPADARLGNTDATAQSKTPNWRLIGRGEHLPLFRHVASVRQWQATQPSQQMTAVNISWLALRERHVQGDYHPFLLAYLHCCHSIE